MRTKDEIEKMTRQLHARKTEVEHLLSEVEADVPKANLLRLLLSNVDAELEALEWALSDRRDIPVATNQLSDVLRQESIPTAGNG